MKPIQAGLFAGLIAAVIGASTPLGLPCAFAAPPARLNVKVRAGQINRLELCAREVQPIKVRILGATTFVPTRPTR
jgi:hypothetical protein